MHEIDLVCVCFIGYPATWLGTYRSNSTIHTHIHYPRLLCLTQLSMGTRTLLVVWNSAAGGGGFGFFGAFPIAGAFLFVI